VLSEYEQRVLAELERSCEADRPEPPATRSRLGPALVALIAGLCALLLLTGAAAAALALATAAAIGRLSWHLWVHRGDGAAALLLRAGHRAGRRPGESVRRYLRWLSEAE